MTPLAWLGRTVPVTVIGGYLGSGKTSTLNHLLAVKSGPRLGVLVNDFGSISIDEKLIVSRDGDVVTLANGCACCSVAGDLGEALDKLARAKSSPEHIVVEASGVADPARIAALARSPGLEPRAPVVVVDAETIVARASDKFVGRLVGRQIAKAGLIVLNKVDLVARERLEAARAFIAAKAPEVSVIETSYGRVDAAALMGAETATPSRFVCDLPEDDATGVFESHVWTADGPVDVLALTEAVRLLPGSVMRAKGLVRGSEGRLFEIHRVGARVAATPFEARTLAMRSELVVIALSGMLDWAQLDRSLNACRVQGGAK